MVTAFVATGICVVWPRHSIERVNHGFILVLNALPHSGPSSGMPSVHMSAGTDMRKSKPPPPMRFSFGSSSYGSCVMRVTTGPLWALTSCSNSAVDDTLPLHIRCLPSIPLEFARPSGKRFDFELKSRRGVSAPLAHNTTAFAFCLISFLSLSK